jgi:Ser/Thr protein kinase RdoA (MazF antagonist)
MMRLSTMATVDGLIDEQGRNRVADLVAAPWAPSRGSVVFFRSSANFVYRMTIDGRLAYLRFAADAERRRDQLEHEAAMVMSLADTGALVAAPVPSRGGAYVESVETDVGLFHAVAFEALHGEILEADELSEAACMRWGQALARLHETTATLPQTVLAARPTWRESFDACGAIAEGDPLLANEYARLAAELGALPQGATTYGLIHGDFQPDNLVWIGDRIGILDFADAARHWYAADIAIALADLVEAPDAPAMTGRIEACLAGYRSVRALPDEEIDHLATFSRLHRFVLHAGLLRTLDLSVDAATPPWLGTLTARLASRLDAYRKSLAG